MLADLTVIAMIPARKGSERLPRKNLAMVGNKPMIQHVIEAAKKCRYFNEVIVNTDDEQVKEIAGFLKSKTYDRRAENATSESRSDEVVFEFMEHHPCDILVWVNSTTPLQTSKEMEAALQNFHDRNLDSLFTVYQEYAHCNFKGKPINYDPAESFAKSQDMEPIERFPYSLMMWKCQKFKETYLHSGKGLFCGKSGTFPVSKLSSLTVKNAEDLMIVDYIARCRTGTYDVSYYRVPEEPTGKDDLLVEESGIRLVEKNGSRMAKEKQAAPAESKLVQEICSPSWTRLKKISKKIGER